MPILRHRLLNPLNLAGLLTLGAVALSLRGAEPAMQGWLFALLGAFTAAQLALSLLPPRLRWFEHVLIATMPVLALVMLAIDHRAGTAPILLVVWTAVAFADWPPRLAAAAVALVDVAFYFVLRDFAQMSAPFMTVLVYAGFQGFAALCMHYARTAEHARDQLARVNADLLATRALLADSARDAERLRLARELHDVAGHKLTAMRLHLRALAGDPAFAARDDIRTLDGLSADLLADIRGVVQAMRDTRGLDLETALRALAAPFPRPALQLAIADDVRVDDAAVADTLLRLVQEALTNSARHAHAATLHVTLQRAAGRLHLRIEDDGRVRENWQEGNGIAGMRERVAALHGDLAVSRNPSGALRIDASLPA